MKFKKSIKQGKNVVPPLGSQVMEHEPLAIKHRLTEIFLKFARLFAPRFV